jgi:hypothetical protein
MKVDISRLLTVKNYAKGEGVTPSYIYKLTKEGKMNLCTIDGVKFVELSKYPTLPVVNRR